MLSDHGLLRALEALTARLPVPVDVEVALEERPPRDVEATAYYIVAEALTNVARHAEATGARVTSAATATSLRVEVADDGRGGADAAAGTGHARPARPRGGRGRDAGDRQPARQRHRGRARTCRCG